MNTTSAPEYQITVTRDEFDTFSYSFRHNDVEKFCCDFSSADEAVKGAKFHIRCILDNLPHEVVYGLGACYTGA